LGGAPQIRPRVYVPAIFVGTDVAAALSNLPPLLSAASLQVWPPAAWRIGDFLEAGPVDAAFRLSETRHRAIDLWNDLIPDVDESLTGYPIWTDVFLGRLRTGPEHPNWKNFLIQRNENFFERNEVAIRAWLKRHKNLAGVEASYRKLEWQAQDSPRDLWRLLLHFRPSGIRAKPLTYLPAFVAIGQTPVIGPLRRRITPREAARVQGFGDSFELNVSSDVAYRQLGNAVPVGATRLVATALVGTGVDVPIQWKIARERSQLALGGRLLEAAAATA
jgi:DNA (cytosine-5)-methyltransferase 1